VDKKLNEVIVGRTD